MISATEGCRSSDDGAVMGYVGGPSDDGAATSGGDRPPDDGVGSRDSGRPPDDGAASRDGGGPPDGGTAGVLVASNDAIRCIGICGGSDDSPIIFFVMHG